MTRHPSLSNSTANIFVFETGDLPASASWNTLVLGTMPWSELFSCDRGSSFSATLSDLDLCGTPGLGCWFSCRSGICSSSTLAWAIDGFQKLWRCGTEYLACSASGIGFGENGDACFDDHYGSRCFIFVCLRPGGSWIHLRWKNRIWLLNSAHFE